MSVELKSVPVTTEVEEFEVVTTLHIPKKEVEALLFPYRHNKIQAIKVLRDHYHIGLHDAKQLVECLDPFRL